MTQIKRNAGFTGGMLSVPAGAKLALDGVTVDGNKSEVPVSTGSMISVSGANAQLALTGATLQNNSCTGALGGAVNISGGAKLTMDNARILNCSAQGGGAIYIRDSGSAIDASDCRFEGNGTTTSYGGAVYVYEGGTAEFQNTVFHDNSSGGNFGGGAVYVHAASFAATDSAFTNNKATHDFEYGSAISIMTNGRVTLNVCSFANNSPAAYGVIAHGGQSLTMNGAMEFADNTQSVCFAAPQYISTDNDASLSLTQNSAPIPLALPAASWKAGTDVMKNADGTTATDAQIELFNATAYGGEMWNVRRSESADDTLELSMLDTEYVYIDGRASGNGDDTRPASSPTAPFKTLRRCYQFMKDNAISAYILVVGEVPVTADIALTRTNCSVGNVTLATGTAMNGIVRYDDTMQPEGVTPATSYTGALLNVTAGTMTLKGITVDGNGGNVAQAENCLLAVDGTAAAIVLQSDGAEKCVLRNNKNLGDTIWRLGGAIRAGANTNVTISGTTIEDCASCVYGGAIYFAGATLTLSGGNTFVRNSAVERGGAIHIQAGSMYITNGNAFENNAVIGTTGLGGAISKEGPGTISMAGNNAFRNNTTAARRIRPCRPSPGRAASREERRRSRILQTPIRKPLRLWTRPLCSRSV